MQLRILSLFTLISCTQLSCMDLVNQEGQHNLTLLPREIILNIAGHVNLQTINHLRCVCKELNSVANISTDEFCSRLVRNYNNDTQNVVSFSYNHKDSSRDLFIKHILQNDTGSYNVSAIMAKTVPTSDGRLRLMKFLITTAVPVNELEGLMLTFARQYNHKKYPFEMQLLCEAAIKTNNIDVVKILLSAGFIDIDEGYLLTAIHYNNVGIVTFLLNRGAKANIQYNDYRQRTALTQAAKIQNKEIINLLLAHEATIDDINDEGNTALHIVCSEGLPGANLLLDSNAHTDIKNKQGNTALHLLMCSNWYSVYKKLNETVNLLLAHGANIDEISDEGNTALHIACLKEQSRFANNSSEKEKLPVKVKILLDNNARTDIRNKQGDTALHILMRFSHAKYDIWSNLPKETPHSVSEAVKLLIEKSSNLTIQNNNGFSLLHTISHGSKFYIIEIDQLIQSLIDKGADVNALDNNGYTALDQALQSNNVAIAECLLKNNAPISSVDKFTIDHLDTACKLKMINIIEHILKNHSDQHKDLENAFERSYDDMLCLRYEAHQDSWYIMKILLENSANISLKNGIVGYTPLHYASMHNCIEVVRLLCDQQGIEIDAQNIKGETPLCYAAYNGNNSIIEILIAHGANPTIEVKDQETGKQKPLLEIISSLRDEKYRPVLKQAPQEQFVTNLFYGCTGLVIAAMLYIGYKNISPQLL